MNKLGFAAAVLMIVAVAAWAYNVNYRTKMTLGRIDALRAEMAAEREHIQVLKVEWAWLNSPDRLARLVEANADRLGLAPMSPEHFGRVAAVPFPPKREAPVLVADETPVGEDEQLVGLAMATAASIVPPPRPPLRSRP